MVYIYLIGIPALLLITFLAFAALEIRTGRRVLAGRRYVLDTRIARARFILKHVDWGAFANDVARTAFDRALHDIAHGSLIAVRALERELTRVVRTLRARREPVALIAPDDAPPSRIGSAVTYVKKTVKRARKKPAIAARTIGE